MIDLGKLEKIDNDDEVKQIEKYSSAIQYLQSTDWQYIANIERGRKIPDEIQAKRKAALDILTAEPGTET